MSWEQAAGGIGAALAAVVCLAHPGIALAISADEMQAMPQLLASNARTRSATAGTAKPAAANRWTTLEHSGSRARAPLRIATAAGEEQAGYVHYFLLRMPDDVVEMQVGIELPGGKIAWSVPGLGVVVSPFIKEGTLPVPGAEYEYWHLYGIRPFPDDASMAALRKDIDGRVQRWVEAQTAYCENDGPFSDCMSCLGFVLRVLFPGRYSDYPELPADFKRAGRITGYSTRELLLYLTGMYEFPTREARLQRIEQLALPDGLRKDLSELVHAMAPGEYAPVANGAPQDAATKRPALKPTRVGTRPVQRRKL